MFAHELSSWFAVQVVPRHESMVASLLAYKGYQQFLPTHQCRRKWCDRNKTVEVPLFPGYVFCRLTHQVTSGLVLTTPGVIRLVGFGGKPYSVPDAEIDAIRRLVLSSDVMPAPYLKVGQKVQINNGPLAGIIGILVQVKNRRRIVVSIDLVMKSVSANVDSLEVRPVADGVR